MVEGMEYWGNLRTFPLRASQVILAGSKFRAGFEDSCELFYLDNCKQPVYK